MSSDAWQLVSSLLNRTCSGAPGLTIEDEVTLLYRELHASLLRYLGSLGLPAAEAEDIVQETFLHLFEHLRRQKPRHNLRGWLFRVARNLGRKRAALLRRSPIDAVDDPASLRCHSTTDPEEMAAWNRRQAHLANVVQALPERDRSCLLLRAEGLRYREIAEALDISLGTVANSLARSLGKLDTVNRS